MCVILLFPQPEKVVDNFLNAYPVFHKPDKVRRTLLLLLEQGYIKEQTLRKFLETEQEQHNEKDYSLREKWQGQILAHDGGLETLLEIIRCGEHDSKKLFCVVDRLYALELRL